MNMMENQEIGAFVRTIFYGKDCLLPGFTKPETDPIFALKKLVGAYKQMHEIDPKFVEAFKTIGSGFRSPNFGRNHCRMYATYDGIKYKFEVEYEHYKYRKITWVERDGERICVPETSQHLLMRIVHGEAITSEEQSVLEELKDLVKNLAHSNYIVTDAAFLYEFFTKSWIFYLQFEKGKWSFVWMCDKNHKVFKPYPNFRANLNQLLFDLPRTPTQTGFEKYPPNGLYSGTSCTCETSCDEPCTGKCGCAACAESYGDYLSKE